MTLSEGKSGASYIVEDVTVDQRISRRLEALGLNDGTQIQLLNQKRNKGAFIIMVRGTRLALGRKIADGITVREAS